MDQNKKHTHSIFIFENQVLGVCVCSLCLCEREIYVNCEIKTTQSFQTSMVLVFVCKRDGCETNK